MILENVSQEIELRDNYLVGLTNLGGNSELRSAILKGVS